MIIIRLCTAVCSSRIIYLLRLQKTVEFCRLLRYNEAVTNHRKVFALGWIVDILKILDSSMTRPELYGWFHLLSVAATVVLTVILCRLFKQGTERQVRTIVLTVAVMVAILEIYKQINYTFEVENGLVQTDYQWYAFPFQFCSTPMYVGLLAGLTKKGKIHDALCAFLATYAIFAGLCVMLYPADVFISTIGINIQTMVCHGSMIAVGVYLLYCGYVPCRHKTILKAVPVFAVCVAVAAVMNEIAYASGLLATETFNMFFISPHCEPSLPVYSLVQQVVPYPWCLIIYLLAFSLAAYLILLVAMFIRKCAKPAYKECAKV